MSASAEYACENTAIFDKITDQAWFSNFIKYQYRDVVFRSSPISPIFSDYWISQAFLHYVKDVSRVSNNEYNGKPLDHYKRAGLLCYWLRRCPPIAEFGNNADFLLSGVKLRSPNTLETIHGNQWAAFDIGFRICRFFQAFRNDTRQNAAERAKIERISLQGEAEYLQDLCYILSDKNMSPHAIGIIYRSLFISVVK
jgi:hypothetical protein